MTPSFKNVITYIKTTLETDTALAAFCTTALHKTLKVSKKFKKRTEITLNDFPIIIITRPEVRSKQESNAPAYDRNHTVRLYCGFHQPDADLAFDQVIEFEELIDQAILSDDRTLGGLVDHIDPGASANDEGMFHPIYFIAKDFIISREEVYT